MKNRTDKTTPQRNSYRVILAGLLLWGCAGAAMALDVNGPGFTPLGQIIASSISIKTASASYAPGSVSSGINFILSSSDVTPLCNDSALPNKLTPDGKYYGWELSPGTGVYGVIYDSSVTGWVWKSSSYTGKHTITATWQASGKASTNGTDRTANCYAAMPHGGSNSVFYLRENEDTLSGVVKYGVYVDSTAPKAGNYTLSFYLGKFQGTFTPVSKAFTVNLTTCTVSTPAQVRFGDLDAGSVTPVFSSDGGLDISCSGKTPTINLSYGAQAVSATRSATELVMSNSENQTQGVVRGFVGSTAEADAGCSDKTSSVRFGAPAASLATGADNNMTLMFPLKWVLCPVASASPGKGSASAILDIHWQ